MQGAMLVSHSVCSDDNSDLIIRDLIIQNQPDMQGRLEKSIVALDDFPSPTSRRNMNHFKPRYLHYLLLFTASGGSNKSTGGSGSTSEEFIKDFFQWYFKDADYDGRPCWYGASVKITF